MRTILKAKRGSVKKKRIIDISKAAEAVGSYTALAERLEVPLSTLHGWYQRGRVPPWRAHDIVEFGREEKINVFKKRKRRKRLSN